MDQNNVVEQVIYKIKEGISESDFIRQNESLNKWVMDQPGFLYRSLTKAPDDMWIDIVYWKNMESAQKAAETFSSAPECAQVMQAIVEDSVSISHLDVVLQIGYDSEET